MIILKVGTLRPKPNHMHHHWKPQNPNRFKAYIQAQQIIFKTKPFPILSQKSLHIHGHTFHLFIQINFFKKKPNIMKTRKQSK